MRGEESRLEERDEAEHEKESRAWIEHKRERGRAGDRERAGEHGAGERAGARESTRETIL